MQTPPRLCDPEALRRNRARAARAPVTFLMEQVAAEVQERLIEVNRRFTAPAIVTGWPGFWAGVMPGAQVVPDDDTLSLTPGAHDLVLHALSLHWAADPIGQLVQCRHALRPDGLLIAVLFGGQTLHELRASLAAAEAEVTGGLSPRVAPMGEIRDLGALLQRAGLALPVADATPLTVSYPTLTALLHDLRAMGEGNALAGRLRHPTRRAVMARAAAIYAETFATPDGRLPATFDIITLTGWAPAPDQPQPLRPGSATHRLADALGATPLAPTDD
ncbi:MAG: SAM-dependent methyltransferase [Rhodobacterales bacterium]|nr:SAM-dependent methyltransferase [Rhodobacterales bacterium]NCT11240.1 SAM-dependent methyltransferase [Rhodobacterales bacterium]